MMLEVYLIDLKRTKIFKGSNVFNGTIQKKKVSHKKIKTVNLLVVTKRRFAGKTNPEKT